MAQQNRSLLALGRALLAAKGYAASAVGETYARAKVLAEQLDRSDCLGSRLWGQWAFHLIRCELGRALSLAERMGQIGKAQDMSRCHRWVTWSRDRSASLSGSLWSPNIMN
jgi:hypothetical protein